MACGDVLSLEDLQTAKKHQIFEAEVITGKTGGVAGGASIDYAINQVTGQIQKTMPAILRDLGFEPASFTFATGGTLNPGDHGLAVYNPAPNGDNNWYAWGGALPKTIPANSTPQTAGGFGATAWAQKTDNVLRDQLASKTGAGLIGSCRSESDLKGVTPSYDRQRAYLSGVNSGTSTGSGYFVFEQSSTQSEYQGVIVKPSMLSTGRWKREAREDLSLYHFGAYGDGTHDDTQAAIDYLNWQRDTGKNGTSLGSGTFLITGTLPFPTNGSFSGNGDDTIISVGMTDTGVLFNIPLGQFAYSWLIEKMKFVCASGGSLRAQILNVAGSLRGAAIRDVSSWEFSRPFAAKGNIWGNLILDGVNAYRISNPILTGDTPFDFNGNTLMMQNIEALGAFDKIIKYTGLVFKLDGFNTGGVGTGTKSAGAIYLENAKSGYIRSGWIELTDANGVSNGEAESIYAKNCTNITIEDINISTGSVWVDGGSKVNVRNIDYAQNNAGLRAINGAKVNATKSGLGKYNLSTDSAKRTYAEPVVVDGNNCGRGLVANPINPFAVMAPSNGAIATMTQDTTNFISGTSSAKFTTFNNTAGGRLTIPCIPNKEYTVCLTAKALTAGISLTLDRDPATATTALTDGHIYVSKTTGFDAAANWVKLNLPVKSTTTTLDVIITCGPNSQFVVDAIDVYAGVSTFNPSQLG